jgi:phenylacetate-CoA ligase
MHAIARLVERRYGSGKVFSIFESSGELLEPHVREDVARILRCRVVDRYGLAEFGIAAYEFADRGLEVLVSEVFPETAENGELVLTGLRNCLMPLIRYRTGDLAKLAEHDRRTILAEVVGRMHDVVTICGVERPTHHVMDVLQHRIGGVDEFQIDARTAPTILRIVTLPEANHAEIAARIEQVWPDAFDVRFVRREDLVLVGERAKFRHVVSG